MTAADEMKEQAVAIFAEHGKTPPQLLSGLVGCCRDALAHYREQAAGANNCLALEEQNHASTKDENQSLRALLRGAREYVNYAAASAISIGSRNVAAESLLARIDAMGGESNSNTARASAEGTRGFSAESGGASGDHGQAPPSAALSGPEGRAEGQSPAERSGDHNSSPDATTVAGNKSVR